ncbi:hypothetical protein Aple_101430 [Acrocarpospora pleiomorpha]|uniref:Uncharacterized protein n=1 Tax=Acrocarpospora pleiomorpha TaxID=90975 RepID=A0A5M3Y4T9_9ACTN|nr:hypothetical protein Aple_101430 [Acrocarpospora pleiomorpha]
MWRGFCIGSTGWKCHGDAKRIPARVGEDPFPPAFVPSTFSPVRVQPYPRSAPSAFGSVRVQFCQSALSAFGV